MVELYIVGNSHLLVISDNFGYIEIGSNIPDEAQKPQYVPKRPEMGQIGLESPTLGQKPRKEAQIGQKWARIWGKKPKLGPNTSDMGQI